MMIIVIIIWIICSLYLYRKMREPLVTLNYTHIPEVDRPVINLADIVGAMGRMENPAAQNVHDGNVRKALWTKYHRLLTEMPTDRTNIIKAGMASLKDFKPLVDAKKYEAMEQVIDNFKNNNTVVDTAGASHKESEIYSVCYHKYKALNLPLTTFVDQIADCVENGHLLCITGRISRYIGVFEGLTEGYLGETELTEELIFQEALNKANAILRQFLEDNKEFRDLYQAQGTLEEEAKLNEFLDLIRQRIYRTIHAEYPTLKAEKLAEIISAI